jgi:hypothetical protein
MPDSNHSQLPPAVDVSAPLSKLKLTFGTRGDRNAVVLLDPAVESMDLSSKGFDAGGAMIIAAFLPRW